jgi:phosphosulfolactate phosphohydrolase-like enzyme
MSEQHYKMYKLLVREVWRPPERKEWLFRGGVIHNMSTDDAIKVCAGFSDEYAECAKKMLAGTEKEQRAADQRAATLIENNPSHFLHPRHVEDIDALGLMNDERICMVSLHRVRQYFQDNGIKSEERWLGPGSRYAPQGYGKAPEVKEWKDG